MYEIERYVRANTLGAAVLLQALVPLRDRIRRLIVASSMSIYGEGLYWCQRCGAERTPGLRPAEQLAARHWEMPCFNCGTDLQPLPTPETKPLAPTSVYAITKQDQEQLFMVVGRAYEIPTVALRYFNVYGPRQSLSNPYTGVAAIFSSRLLNGQPPLVFEDGEQSRDFVHVDDITQANLLALEAENAVFESLNVGTGRSTSVNAMARLLADGLGLREGAETIGKYREGDIRHCVADITAARLRLGYEPKVSLEEGIESLLRWVKIQTADDRVAEASAELEERSLIR
jgi:dTDP-L-rhamnose 4-epimerase